MLRLPTDWKEEDLWVGGPMENEVHNDGMCLLTTLLSLSQSSDKVAGVSGVILRALLASEIEDELICLSRYRR